MAHIDYYFATLSPYTYLAGTRFEAVAKKHGATVTYKPLDIMALFSRTGGTPPKDRHPNRVEYRAQELVRQGKKLDMAFNLKPAHWPTNAAPSSYAIIAAQNAGGGDLGALVHAILRSVWAEEKDIAEDAVVKACLTEAGFDPSLADSGLLEGADTYAANLEEAIDRGAFGAPFYIVDGGQRFWGQDKLEELDLHLSGKL
ncbi:MAG: 2-hydroxychromene-2-carboxylate isomerase [Tateyamaria sp.]|uniref:2-hydroxychromene-2-carboxylate isomerase n=1 Tax=Tateyamaria sp. TaxID=1929288 RepID=UPI00329B56C9